MVNHQACLTPISPPIFPFIINLFKIMSNIKSGIYYLYSLRQFLKMMNVDKLIFIFRIYVGIGRKYFKHFIILEWLYPYYTQI